MPAPDDILLTIPNVSEGRDADVIARIGAAFASTGARLLDVHSDADHHRSVFTLAGDTRAARVRARRGRPRVRASTSTCAPSAAAIRTSARSTSRRSSSSTTRAAARPARRRSSRARSSGAPGCRSSSTACSPAGARAPSCARGGLAKLTERIAAGHVRPDFGPRAPDPRSGAVLVGARAPLVAFNVELAPPATLQDARAIAALIRETRRRGPARRARASAWRCAPAAASRRSPRTSRTTAACRSARLVAAVARHAPVAGCELVGLAPHAAFDGFPDDVPVRNRRTVEDGPRGALLSGARAARAQRLSSYPPWPRRRRSAAASTVATPPA